MPVSLKRPRPSEHSTSDSSPSSSPSSFTDLKSPHKTKVRRIDAGWGVLSGIGNLLGFTNEPKSELFLSSLACPIDVSLSLQAPPSPAAAYPSPDPTDPEPEPEDQDPEIKVVHYRPAPHPPPPRSSSILVSRQRNLAKSLPQPVPPPHRPFASGYVKKTPMFASEVCVLCSPHPLRGSRVADGGGNSINKT
jgi:hypothetical protein